MEKFINETVKRLICGYSVEIDRCRHLVVNEEVDTMNIYLIPSWEADPYDNMYELVGQTPSKWGTFTITGPIEMKQVACNVANKLFMYKKDLEFNQNDVLIGLISHVMSKCM